MKHHSLTKGPIFKTLLLFSIPMIITNTINVLFHAADVAVLSAFGSESAVAAVGACGSLITLMVALFTGLSTGADVLLAKYYGSGDKHRTKKAVATALVIALSSGLLLMIVSLLFSRQFLILMNCQPEVLDMATLYMKIYFAGAPIMMLKTFTMAILRASGDSMRPMIYSIISGVVNVAANIFFIVVLDMTVAGVAIATVLSSALAFVLSFITLTTKEPWLKKARIRDFKLGKIEVIEIVRVGVPTCFCSLFFYAANVVLASAVNLISVDAMTANAIAGQFDGIIYTVGAAIAASTSVMVAQNFGAGQFERIQKTMRISILYVTAVSLALGVLFVAAAPPILDLLSDNPNVIDIAKDRMTLLCLTYFITSIMEVFAFSLRALERQKSTMVVGGICGFGIRTLWRYLVWPLCPTLPMLFGCFAVSAFVAIVIYAFVYREALNHFTLKIFPQPKEINHA